MLTHAHLDHCGYLPRLVSQGFRGPRVLHAGHRRISARSCCPTPAGFRKKTRRTPTATATRSTQPALPLYTEVDAFRAVSQLQPVRLRPADAGRGRASRWSSSTPGTCSVRRTRAMRIDGRTILFGGDLGRFGRPVLPDPTTVDGGGLPARRVHLRQSRPRSRTTTATASRAIVSETARTRRQADHSGVRDRARRGADLLDQAARGRRSGSRCCRCSSTARWRPRRSRATPSGCSELDPEMQPEEHDDKAPHDAAAHESADRRRRQARQEREVCVFCTERFRIIASAAGVEAADGLEDAGDRHLGERHGDGRARAAPSQGGAAGREEHRAVCRLSRPRARAGAGWSTVRRASRFTARWSRSPPAIERIDSMSAHADSQRDPALARRLHSAPPKHDLHRARRAGCDGGPAGHHQGKAGLADEDA